ncbi:MAG: GNAT family N-acetyltransferase [Spirochaetota bacterium]|nr:GNAT family N-acetyltransferase [Spirochaetota bacterium]
MKKTYRSFYFREIQQSDQDFLFEMLYQAVYVPPGSPPPDRSILEEPEIRRYAESWGKEGDFGYIAVDTVSERRIGAVWLRYFDSEHKGYGYISDDIPEMSIAVLPDKRGMGIGTALLDALLRHAAGRVAAISLSVDPENPAVRLYKRFGFVECGVSGDSIIMRIDS